MKRTRKCIDPDSCGKGVETEVQQCQDQHCEEVPTTTEVLITTEVPTTTEATSKPNGTNCGWCPWIKDTKITYSLECAPAWYNITRKPECPAQILPGTPCTGESLKYEWTTPSVTRWKWDWHSSNHGANLLDFECKGGCIRSHMVSLSYDNSNAIKRLSIYSVI